MLRCPICGICGCGEFTDIARDCSLYLCVVRMTLLSSSSRFTATIVTLMMNSCGLHSDFWLYAYSIDTVDRNISQIELSPPRLLSILSEAKVSNSGKRHMRLLKSYKAQDATPTPPRHENREIERRKSSRLQTDELKDGYLYRI